MNNYTIFQNALIAYINNLKKDVFLFTDLQNNSLDIKTIDLVDKLNQEIIQAKKILYNLNEFLK